MAETKPDLAEMSPEERESKLIYPLTDAAVGINARSRGWNIDVLAALRDADRRAGAIEEVKLLLHHFGIGSTGRYLRASLAELEATDDQD